jgi:hypothetical protein
MHRLPGACIGEGGCRFADQDMRKQTTGLVGRA